MKRRIIYRLQQKQFIREIERKHVICVQWSIACKILGDINFLYIRKKIVGEK